MSALPGRTTFCEKRKKKQVRTSFVFWFNHILVLMYLLLREATNWCSFKKNSGKFSYSDTWSDTLCCKAFETFFSIELVSTPPKVRYTVQHILTENKVRILNFYNFSLVRRTINLKLLGSREGALSFKSFLELGYV